MHKTCKRASPANGPRPFRGLTGQHVARTMEIYGMTGEKLGVIGQVQAETQQQSDLPQWKLDFLRRPSISVRKSIAWVSFFYTSFASIEQSTSTVILSCRHTNRQPGHALLTMLGLYSYWLTSGGCIWSLFKSLDYD